jgi:vancomycin resistance protein YoaR
MSDTPDIDDPTRDAAEAADTDPLEDTAEFEVVPEPEHEHVHEREPVSDYVPYESRRSRAATGAHVSSADRGRGRTALTVIALIAAVLALVVLGDIAVSWGRIHPGVRVGNVAVGSLTADAARVALSDAFAKSSASPVTAVFGKTTWKVTDREVGATLETTDSVSAAMAVGRTGGAWAMVTDRIKAVFGGVEVTSHVGDDVAKTDALLDRIAAAVAEPSHDASISISGSTVTFTKSEPGRKLDREAMRDALLGAFLSADRSTDVLVVPAVPQVVDADARQAYLDAQKLVAGAVTVTYGTKSVVVPAGTVAASVRFDRRPTETPAVELSQPSTTTTATAGSGATSTAPPQRMMLVAAFDQKKLGAAIATLTKGLGRPARDASFVAVNGKVKITASQVGHGPDLATLATDLARVCVGGGARSAVLKLGETLPKLTTDAAKQMGISDRISTFTTTYSTANPARTNNVHLLARALDAKLVPPGGIFSFNQTAGERTASKGYQEAPAIVQGKLVPQLGGGVCQVGTTFFNTVFFSGLPIVERHNHSFYISHYPKGRDATVSWGGPDFKFRNDTKGWILIRATTTADSLTISLYGTDPGYTVEYHTGSFTNVVPHKVTEVKDPTLKKGARIVTDGGVDGCRLLVTRTVYKGGVVVRTDDFVSIYSPKEEVVRVGTKEPSKPATSTPTP